MPFYYSGCQANANNFESADECQRACPPSIGGAAPATPVDGDAPSEPRAKPRGQQNSFRSSSWS